MSIEFICGCGRRLHTADGTAGRRAKCPSCGSVLTIPLSPTGLTGVHPPTVVSTSQSDVTLAVNQCRGVALRKVSTAITVLFIAVAASIMIGLIEPQSSLASFPLTLLIGIWPAWLSLKAHSWMGLIFSLSPLMFTCPTVIAMMMGTPGDVDVPVQPEFAIRFYLFVNAILWVPLGLAARVRTCRPAGIDNALSGRWLMAVVAGTCTLTVASVPICRIFATNTNPADMLSKADAMWSSGELGDRPEAIILYKSFLKTTMGRKRFSAIMEGNGKELPRIFRRVIEYEADYGDPGEAVDWIRLSIDNEVVLYLHSKKAKELMKEVIEYSKAPS